MRKKYRIVGMPIIEVGARFVKPCRFDDEIIVKSEVSDWGRSGFTVSHRIFNAGDLAIEGFAAGLGGRGSEASGRDQSASGVVEIIASLADPTGATMIKFDRTHGMWNHGNDNA
jgi:Thioesterase superfamily